MMYIIEKCKLLKDVELELSQALTEEKNLALQKVAEALNKNREEILEGNRLDIENAINNNMIEGLVDRLRLDNKLLLRHSLLWYNYVNMQLWSLTLEKV